MRFSEAIKIGMTRYPKSTFGANERGGDRACSDGCARYGFAASAWADDRVMPKEYWEGYKAFEKEYGFNLHWYHDVLETSRDKIVMMFEEIGH